MPKKIRVNSFKVVIEVPVIEGRRHSNVTVDEARNEVHRITRDAKRHLAHEHDLSGMSIESDTDAICEHCESRWSEVSELYNGGCCDEDEKNNPASEEEKELDGIDQACAGNI